MITKEDKAAYDKIYKQKHIDQNKLSRKVYYQKHKQKELQAAVQYRLKNKEILKKKKYHQTTSARYSMLKARCKIRNIDCTISYEQYLDCIAKPCFYCNFKLGKKVMAGSGLDRIDSSLGYIDGNIVSCCRICNCIKGNFLSVTETQAAVQAIINLRNKNANYLCDGI